jgi:uncharacterized phage protein (TIGR01671 family)
MREIEFRAWDKINKEWGNLNELANWDICSFTATIGRGNEQYPYTSFRIESCEVYEIMQYTGLKDKNGKEIYEGDILATSNNDPEYDIWNKEDNGYIQVVYESPCFTTVGDWSWDLYDPDNESIYGLEFIEVIGNIYDNPDLLLKEKK